MFQEEDRDKHSSFTRQSGTDLVGLNGSFDTLDVMRVKHDESPEEVLENLAQIGSLKKV